MTDSKAYPREKAKDTKIVKNRKPKNNKSFVLEALL